MSMNILRKSGLLVGLLVASMLMVMGIACGGSDAPERSSPTTGSSAAPAPAAPVAPAPAAKAAAPAAPAKAAAPKAAAPAKKAASPATKAAAKTAAPAKAAAPSGPSGKLIRAHHEVNPVFGTPWSGPYKWSAADLIGIGEHLFYFDKGNAMTPQMAKSWSVDPAGTKVTIELNKGMKWQSPKGYEDTDFGEADAESIVRWFNTVNGTVNPDSSYPDSGDLGAIFTKAEKTGDYTFTVGLVSPVFFCLPLSEFGCLGAAPVIGATEHVDIMGADWASKNAVMTGPYVHGDCNAGDRCSVYAVEDHWRATPNVAEIEVIQVPEAQTQVAMLKSGEVDMAVVDYKLLADVVTGSDTLRFLETMPGGYVGQSIIFPGNLWEETHARSGEALNAWDSPAYDKDVPWIGDPWQVDSYHEGSTDSSVVRYTDTDNPAGMSDMEQARLVRLALSTALDRAAINDVLLNGIGTPIYSEYMGPEYPGWDPDRDTGIWDATGNKTSETGGVIHKLPDGDIVAAGALLDQAGYPADASGSRPIDGLVLQAYAAEAGPVGLEVADTVMSDWARLGIEISGLVEDYGGVISPRMKRREQYLPVLKNCDVHSNVWPQDWPIPPVDTSRTRPSWGCGFESKFGAKMVSDVLMEKDAAERKRMHIDSVDYSMYWLQYAGVFQVPKGIVVNDKIKEWNAPQQHYANVSNNPELIVLK